MPMLLLRIVIWALASVCCVSVAVSATRVADCLTAQFTPFGVLSVGILVAAIGYALSRLRRP